VGLDALVVGLACSYVLSSSMKPSSVMARPLGFGLGLVDFTVFTDGLLLLQLHVQGGVFFNLQGSRQRRPFLSSWPSPSAPGPLL